MKRGALYLQLLGACLLAMPAVGHAQATRTWISGVGDDANPCSRTAPCKTFAGAISKTATNGEINCLDPGGFGGVTITKSISLVCQYTEAGVLVSGTNGIIINAGATGIVRLVGMDLQGVNTGLAGVKILAAQSVSIEDSRISNFNNAAGFGIQDVATTAHNLTVLNTIVTDSRGASGGGILVQPGVGGSAAVTIKGVKSVNNTFGISLNGTGSTAGLNVKIEDSTFNSNTGNGIICVTNGSHSGVNVMINNSASSSNGGNGVDSSGGGCHVFIGSSTVSGNTGVALNAASSGTVDSYKTNQTDGNTGGFGNATTNVVLH